MLPCWFSVFRVRKYFFRICGSVVMNYGSGSERPIYYGSGRIRILPLHFCGHWKNKYVADGSKSLITGIELFGIFNKKSKDPNSESVFQNYRSGSRRPINYGFTGSGTLFFCCTRPVLKLGGVWWDGPGGSIFSRVYLLSRIRMSMVVIVEGVKVELLHHTTAALLGDKVGIIKCSARLSHFRYPSFTPIYPPSVEIKLNDAHFDPLQNCCVISVLWIRFWLGRIRIRNNRSDSGSETVFKVVQLSLITWLFP